MIVGALAGLVCLFACECYARVNNDIVCYQITAEPLNNINNKDYMTYCQLIRERIRQKIESTYVNYYREGDVNLSFTLKFDGSLLELNVMPDSTKDKKLLDIVTSCVKKASPFPKFPGALSLPKASFCLLISFKER